MYVRGKIEKLRKKLSKSIERHGLNAEETRKISLELDELINEYNKNQQIFLNNSIMKEAYDKSVKKLKRITIEFGEFPTTTEWNYYARENNLLSSESMKFILHLNWNELREKILYEINKKIF